VSTLVEARQFRLPDLGEGLTEAEVVRWRVAPGDDVVLNQVLVEVETEKAVVELPSPCAGRVRAVLAEAGETVAVGAPLVTLEVAGDERTGGGEVRHDQAEDDDAAPVPTLVGYGPRAPQASRRRGRRRTERERGHVPSTSPAPASARPLAAPPVRFMARQRGVDLTEVTGHGPGGVITREDLAAHLAAAGLSSAGQDPAAAGGVDEPASRDGVATAAPARETREPVRGVRKRMAEAMVTSVATAPQASVFLTVDVTATMQLVTRLRENRRFEGLNVTPLAVVARAVVLALAEHPALNSSWDEVTTEIVTKHYVDLGIAVAGPRGLVVPAIRDAHGCGFRELVTALGTLTARARADACTPEELRGGTFTVTNVGVFGVDGGVPILNPGQAGILAFGAVQRRPWEHEGELALRDVVTLTLTFDHRLADGEQAARFLTAVGEIVSDPTHLLAFG